MSTQHPDETTNTEIDQWVATYTPLRRYCMLRGRRWTQARIAKRLRLSRSLVSQVETGARVPKNPTIRSRIAQMGYRLTLEVFDALRLNKMTPEQAVAASLAVCGNAVATHGATENVSDRHATQSEHAVSAP